MAEKLHTHTLWVGRRRPEVQANCVKCAKCVGVVKYRKNRSRSKSGVWLEIQNSRQMLGARYQRKNVRTMCALNGTGFMHLFQRLVHAHDTRSAINSPLNSFHSVLFYIIHCINHHLIFLRQFPLQVLLTTYNAISAPALDFTWYLQSVIIMWEN